MAGDQHYKVGLEHRCSRNINRATQCCQAPYTFILWSWHKETIEWTDYHKKVFLRTPRKTYHLHVRNSRVCWPKAELRKSTPEIPSPWWKLYLSTSQAYDPPAFAQGTRVKNHLSFVSVRSFTLELLNVTWWEEKDSLIHFGICKELSQILTGTEHEQVKPSQLPGDTQNSVKQGQSSYQ